MVLELAVDRPKYIPGMFGLVSRPQQRSKPQRGTASCILEGDMTTH